MGTIRTVTQKKENSLPLPTCQSSQPNLAAKRRTDTMLIFLYQWVGGDVGMIERFKHNLINHVQENFDKREKRSTDNLPA
jgi:hypothetical protein